MGIILISLTIGILVFANSFMKHLDEHVVLEVFDFGAIRQRPRRDKGHIALSFIKALGKASMPVIIMLLLFG